MAAIAVIPLFMPFALCRGKRKATYRIRKHEVTHTTKKQSDISHQEEEVTTFGGRAVLFYNKNPAEAGFFCFVSGTWIS